VRQSDLNSCAFSNTRIRLRRSSYTELRKNRAALMDALNNDHTPLLITRGGGKPCAVLMSFDDVASFDETRYLLSTPANAEMLRKSVSELEEGKVKARNLIE
jgi:antitoxin YefM